MNSCELVLLSFLILLQKGRILMKYCMDHTPDIDRPSYKLYFMYNTHFSLFVSVKSDFFASFLHWYGIKYCWNNWQWYYWPCQLTQMCGGAGWCCPDHSFTPIHSHQSITIWFVHSPHCPIELTNEPSRSFTVPGEGPTKAFDLAQ